MKESVIIWSNNNKTKLDDLDMIKEHLLRNKNNVTVSIISAKLKKDQEDVKTYLVDYEYVDLDKSKREKGKM